MDEIAEKIRELKAKKGAVLLVHNYQGEEIQLLADFLGDSLDLSKKAKTATAQTIVFCGVDFMAETAAILAPEKTVLLPAPDACCPMAEMITSPELEMVKSRYPDAAVVCYVNTSAEVKAASDICCTSANAVHVVNSVHQDKVIFVPDRNLARYTARFTDKEVLPWEGFCIVHDQIRKEDVQAAQKRHPRAVVLVHPECRPEVIDLADTVASTSGIIREVCSSPENEFIIGTETGILHRIHKECPKKKCYPLSETAVCRNMKKTDLGKVRDALKNLQPQIHVPEDIARRARSAIDRMLAL
jgi:quinolinate synthase